MNQLGYVYSPAAIEAFRSASPMICQVGDLKSGKGQDFFLFEIEQKISGSVASRPRQEIGDCVSQGTARALEAIQWVLKAKQPAFDPKPIATEYIYGIARIQVGKGACGYEDGAVVAWAFEGTQKYGFLPRGVYGKYDLSKYDPALAKKFGTPRVGAPPELIAEAQTHLVTRCQLLQGSDLYEQARDVIFNGGAIVSGSNVLYGDRRDAQGFCKPSQSGGHCVAFIGFTESMGRPGVLYAQSWGPNMPVGGAVEVALGGGRKVTLPPGTFFVDAANFNKMHAREAELWALWESDGWLLPDDKVPFVFS